MRDIERRRWALKIGLNIHAYGNINPGSAMTVLHKKGDFDKIDVANFKASDLKEIATYYHAT